MCRTPLLIAAALLIVACIPIHGKVHYSATVEVPPEQPEVTSSVGVDDWAQVETDEYVESTEGPLVELGDELIVDEPPPAPMVERVSPSPGPGYVWVNGYWSWNGEGHEWTPGYCALPPAPGYVWVRFGWIVVDGHYRFVQGRWVAPALAPRVPYVHPAPPIRRAAAYRYTPPPRYRALAPRHRR